ncbi:CPBP family intramembrane glutamic endopeptidase [uncultured Ruminococcus sp.]|jgi:membrane protease YdiL (CAAX protease family)|uniref:CPBP family intramembrane glutamic endopeptidase n=1 Tax=uncultured Ruminococcus sp. TaxID=165186 RepID=UPI0025D8A058|nr:type II CAAX endopeptidase family protein [uncultured Ruminococcus sp.]
MTNEPFTEETTGQIDPQNPFDNALENSAYRTDYRRFLPQILLPGFQIPLFPERDERRNIRRQMNTAGAGMLLGTLIAQLLFPLAVLLLLLCMDGTTASYFNGDQSGAVRTIMNSGIYMALHCLILAGSNVLVALLGCRRIRQSLGGLFRTTDFSGWKAFQYICIGIGLQYVAVLIYAVLKYVGQGLGMEFPEVSFDYFQTGQSTMLVLLYTCILAPITEELLFRGFLLKSLSVVSTRFGVIVTALLFGLMHGNVQQGILGVLVGLFLGKIVIRHNSLTPSILVHIALNTSSTLISVLLALLPENIGNVAILPLEFVVLALAVMGIAFWFGKERKEPLPYPTQKQATRNRVFWSSPLLLLAFAALLGLMVYYAMAV